MVLITKFEDGDVCSENLRNCNIENLEIYKLLDTGEMILPPYDLRSNEEGISELVLDGVTIYKKEQEDE